MFININPILMSHKEGEGEAIICFVKRPLQKAGLCPVLIKGGMFITGGFLLYISI